MASLKIELILATQKEKRIASIKESGYPLHDVRVSATNIKQFSKENMTTIEESLLYAVEHLCEYIRDFKE